MLETVEDTKKLVGAVAVAVEQTNHEGLFNGDDALDVLADYMQCLLYDPKADNFFVGFSNTGWAWIDAAFDVKHGTVGYFNDNNNAYTPVAKLSNEDAYNLKELIYDDDFDYTVTTVSVND